jgi:MFS family permease
LDTGPIDNAEVSWLGALPCFGGLVGTIVFGWLSDAIGRKKSILLIGIPQISSWLYIRLGTNIVHLYLGRFLGGIAGGGCFILVPMYIAEISDVK